MSETIAPSDTILQTIAARVREARKNKGLSRRVLSEISGVSPRYLAQLEAGKGNTSIILLSRVAQALDKPIDWFLTTDTPCDVAALYAKADTNTQTKVRNLLTPNSRLQRICLIGLRGAGKSTLGKRLATALNVPFQELNAEIETQAGMPIAEILALYGPEGYRKLEADALEEIHTRHENLVLAAAGGIVSDSRTYNRLLQRFHTIWLRASPEDHMGRVRAQGDERPMAGNPAAMEQLKSLLTNRETQYARAQAQLDTSGHTIDQSAEALLNLVNT